MKLIVRLSLLILFFSPFAVLAEIPDQLKNDFKPVSGMIIMPIEEEYLIDMDASDNLQEGDILTLIMAGEKVIHPVTKVVLGTLDLAKGYLQVTRIKSGYSYAKLLSSGVTPKKGDRIKRFEQTPTRFESSQPADTLKEELKIALPHLTWLSDTDKTNPELIFFLADDNLKVLNAAGVELKIYPYREGQFAVPMMLGHQTNNLQFSGPPQKNRSLLNQTVDNISHVIGLGSKDKDLENPGIIQSQQLNNGIWMGPNLDGNPVGLAVADFDGDGQLETAVAMENHLQILRMTDGKLTLIASVNFAAGLHLLSLDTVDIDANGTPELYLSANSGTKLSSQVVEYKQGSYQRTMNRIPWFFRVVDFPQKGRILIAQTMLDSENPFSGQPFRVIRSGNKLKKGSKIPLPTKLNVFSFVPLKGMNNDLLYAYLSTEDDLRIKTPQGTTIWASTAHYGGTEIFFYTKEVTGNEIIQPISIQPRLLTLPTGEILVTQNDGFRVFKRLRNFNRSRVVALKWDGLTLQESWRTSDQNGYLADYTWADADNDGQNELVMVVKFKNNSLLQKGHVNVVVYELNQ